MKICLLLLIQELLEQAGQPKNEIVIKTLRAVGDLMSLLKGKINQKEIIN